MASLALSLAPLMAGCAGTPDPVIGPVTAQQVDSSGQADAVLAVTIEVHHRIGTWPGAQLLRDALVDSAARVQIAGFRVTVPSPETNLLHLVAGDSRGKRACAIHWR